MSPSQLINTDRYPLGEPSSAMYRQLVDESRSTFGQAGVALLPSFLTSQAVAAMSDEAGRLVPKAFFCRSDHNVYLTDAESALGADHPANHMMRTNVGSIAMDYLDPNGPLRRLYDWPNLTDFIAQVVDVTELHTSDDPLGAVSVNVFAPGDAHAWHFDESRFSVTIMLAPAAAGGHFDYVRGLRDSGYGDTKQIRHVLQGEAPAAERLAFEPGTLSIFAGRHTMHRVTTIEGTSPRLVPVLTYAQTPGYRNSDAVRRLFWGRTG